MADVEHQPTNPFCVKGRTTLKPGPLCPWAVAEHLSEYLPIDRTEEAYVQFNDRLSQITGTEDPLAVVVHSEDGCGKTSLIHRCAYRFREWQSDILKLRSEIIDRSFENVAGMVQIRKCEDTANGVIKSLSEIKGFLPPDVIKELPDVPTNADQVALRKLIDEVARKLLKANCGLVVIVPKVELSDELLLYLSIFQRPGITLFLETDDREVFASARKRSKEAGPSLVALKIGPLVQDDGWRFVEARMRRRSTGVEAPGFTQSGVDEYMATRSTESAISVRELEGVCIALYDEAIRSRQTEIGFEQFAKYYLRVASLGGLYAA